MKLTASLPSAEADSCTLLYFGEALRQNNDQQIGPSEEIP